MLDCICLDIENVVLEEREYLFLIFDSSLRLIWSDSIRRRRQFSMLLVLFERKGFFNWYIERSFRYTKFGGMSVTRYTYI